MRTTFETTTARKAFAKLAKIAALADPARNPNEAERAVALSKLIAALTGDANKHGFTLADFDIEPVASPEAGEQPQPQPEQPEAPKAAEPSARDIERERATANRERTMRHYSGPSQASHATRAPKLAEALARVASPIQRAKSASERDCSALALAETLCDEAGTFCPVAGTFDLGVLSRLASLGYLTVSGERIAVNAAGRELARNTLKKAA